ncbi:hypothetical protein A9Q99_22845 [Gammaproteobacteria bacterium 45_16_T64]|nr:hypothetical protein A9Q99_22845 [Gammaproteobacteria bacterium 45_16_T64]
MKTAKIGTNTLLSTLTLSVVLLATGCVGSDDATTEDNTYSVVEGTDLNRKTSPLLSLNSAGPGGSPNQSLRGGDVITAEPETNSVLIGGLGVDVLIGNSGNDILIGGTEDFNSNVDGDDNGSDNRDRAFGYQGDDVFIWAPGDGSDFFDGGDGVDVLVFGILGEQADSDGTTEGAPFLNVNPPSKSGSQDFDGIFLDEFNQPIVSVSTSPGFCSLIEATSYPNEFELLNLDHIVRFSLRGIANAFDAGERVDDDGLRVAVSIKNVEYVVCTQRETEEGGSTANIQVLDLSTSPASLASLTDLPHHVAEILQ